MFYLSNSLFQFHEVQLKAQYASMNINDSQQFQFHEVQLKERRKHYMKI